MPNSTKNNPVPIAERTLTGLGVSPGIALGNAFRIERGGLSTPEYQVTPEEAVAEVTRFRTAVASSLRQLRNLKAKAAKLPDGASEELGYLVDARLQMLTGSRLIRGVEARIATHLVNAEAAVRTEIDGIVANFARMADRYLAARADDVREVGDRLLRQLMQAPYIPFQHLPEGSIVVAEELTPADTMLLDPAKVLGFVTELGGPESHTAIVARSLGIPAVVGTSGLLQAIASGAPLLLDGGQGVIVLNPSSEALRLSRERVAELAAERQVLRGLAKLPAITQDGVSVQLQANLERPRDVAVALENGAAGVGLFRTEFMFMNRDSLPSEDEQFEAIAEVVAAMGGRPVTVRTLDIGGDKLAPAIRSQIDEGLGHEANPALGLRGVRLSLAHRRLLETQLAAILRAARVGPVRILLPMVSDVAEVKAVRVVMAAVIRRLRRRGAKLPDRIPPIGVMIEVPGAALNADALATEAEFFAIGSNDLTMYTLAIDRGDERVSGLYNPLHPAVLRLIQFSIDAGLRLRREVSVCGEIAGDPRFTPLLLGLGLRDLSMSAPSLGRIKQRVRATDLRHAVARARAIMAQWDPAKIAALMAEE
jgi:phosphotransferase system enzyme I (PtsI)